MSYPLVLTNLARVRCVVVGGGAVAERKVRDLLAGGARPEVISPMLTEKLAAWRDAAQLAHIAREYVPGDLSGAFFVVVATNDRRTNAAIAIEAEMLNVLVNIADDPAAGNVHTAATVRRGDLLIAISSGVPALSAKLRRELDARYGDEYAELAALLRELRSGPARALPPEQRVAFWRALTRDEIVTLLREGRRAEVDEIIQQLLARQKS